MAQRRKPRGSARTLLVRRLGATGAKRVVLVCVLLICALAGIGIWRALEPESLFVSRQDSKNSEATAKKAKEAQETPEEVADTPSRVVVDVDGAVVQPGVYTLEGADLRQRDAVDAAGGLTEDADTSTINLAAPMEDGQKLYIPHEGEVAPSAEASSGVSTTTTSTSATSGLININTATAAELDALPGVGEATAQAIVDERESGGAFSSPEDIMRVSGIGEKKYAKMKDHICV